MSKGFARAGRPRGSEAFTASTLTADVLPHTKGVYIELDASVAKDLVGFSISSSIVVGVSATNTSMLLDIATGAALSETVVVANIPVGGASGGTAGGAGPFDTYLPLYVPQGTRLSARIQGAVTLDTYGPIVVEDQGTRIAGWGGFSIAETIGVDTATSAPTTGDLADNAWDEAVASTANAYRGLTLHPCVFNGGASGTQATIDVGMGAAGSEVVLGSYYWQTTSTEIINQKQGPLFIACDVPAGARLAIKKNSTSDLSAALIGWR